MGRHSAILSVVLVATLAACAPDNPKPPPPTSETSNGPAPTAPPPNIVLISVDTARADHMSLYGYERNTTPFLEALAEESVVFDQAYTPMGITGPSHATLFTGLYPIGHGVVKNGLNLVGQHETLAEILKNGGYDTAAFIGSFVLDSRFGFAQGFDHYDDDILPEEGFVKLEEWEGIEVENGFDRRGDIVMRKAAKWIRETRDPAKPFFTFIHLFDPHAPYLGQEQLLAEVDPDWRTRDWINQSISLYDCEMRWVDELIRGLFVAYDQFEIADNTLTVITADHGEGLMDHGYLMHGFGVYEEEVRIPMILHDPRAKTDGRRMKSPVTLNDLYPTLQAYANIDPVQAGVGLNLRTAITGNETIPEDRAVFLQRRHFDNVMGNAAPPQYFPDNDAPPPVSLDGREFAVRQWPWKYVFNPDTGGKTLYNLQRDPGEQNPHDDPAVRERLQEVIEIWLEEQTIDLAIDAALSDEDREALEALGYIE